MIKGGTSYMLLYLQGRDLILYFNLVFEYQPIASENINQPSIKQFAIRRKGPHHLGQEVV